MSNEVRGLTPPPPQLEAAFGDIPRFINLSDETAGHGRDSNETVKNNGFREEFNKGEMNRYLHFTQTSEREFGISSGALHHPKCSMSSKLSFFATFQAAIKRLQKRDLFSGKISVIYDFLPPNAEHFWESSNELFF
ncbi:hypothetical protein CDAR_591841 [Caerostris darwini]|uniref:Uncharacterized protein n=1 Tax=Caerostris darwini TaxID=1538125 RepID=A0AAV4WZK2_9ARAC|nr:hypothetical protein CDAR_591841 [Caerostris darwini]